MSGLGQRTTWLGFEKLTKVVWLKVSLLLMYPQVTMLHTYIMYVTKLCWKVSKTCQ